MSNLYLSEEDIPIDIHYNKFLDWLISRRHCQQKWRLSCSVIRDKINHAVLDPPPIKEVQKMLLDRSINYFDCKKIIELLKVTEMGKTNIFGQYYSQQTKQWSDIVQLYEKNNVYLAESAQILARNVNYEFPFLKKQIAKCQQIQKDCNKKELDHIAKESEMRRKYESSCKEMGIQGKKIKSELADLLKQLPMMLNQLAEVMKKLKIAVDFYSDFVDFLMKRRDSGIECLKTLKYLQHNSNTTVYEWRLGRAPVQVEESQLVIDTTEEKETFDSDGIDWGNAGKNDVDPGENIDLSKFKITVQSVGEDGESEQFCSEEETKTAIEEEIFQNYDIDWGESDELLKLPENCDSSDQLDDNVARGTDALTILEWTETRNLLLEDLLELEYFLKHRLIEMQNDGNFVCSSQFQNAPQSLQLPSEAVNSMLLEVEDSLAQFSVIKLKHLLQIKGSPRYIDRLKENLKQNLHLADKMAFYQKELCLKRQEAFQEEQQAVLKLDQCRLETRTLQKQMTEEISQRYKGRAVNIVGDINSL